MPRPRRLRAALTLPATERLDMEMTVERCEYGDSSVSHTHLPIHQCAAYHRAHVSGRPTPSFQHLPVINYRPFPCQTYISHFCDGFLKKERSLIKARG